MLGGIPRFPRRCILALDSHRKERILNRRDWLIAALGTAAVSCRKPSGDPRFQQSEIPWVNPERGFYTQVSLDSPPDYKAIRTSGLSMVLLTADLKNFRNTQIREGLLNQLDTTLNSIREAGLKVIFRAAYGFTDDDYRTDPLDLALIGKHISQLAAVLARHAPILWAVQAGMLGPWGEWHGSSHGEIPSLQARSSVVDAWLAALQKTVFVQIRRPRFIREMYPLETDPILSRIGWHNDAMLAPPDDLGTYDEPGWSRAQELNWSNLHARHAPFGGETVPDSLGTPAHQVFEELKLLRISFLNQGYHQGTLNRWKSMKVNGNNLFSLLEKSLGYRLVVKTMFISKNNLINLEIENKGFAPVYTTRKLEAAWLDSATRKPTHHPIDSGLDLKGICAEPGTAYKTFQMPEKKPGQLLGLRNPDSHETLREDGRYAIRLMNQAVKFETSSGWNFFG